MSWNKEGHVTQLLVPALRSKRSHHDEKAAGRNDRVVCMLVVCSLQLCTARHWRKTTCRNKDPAPPKTNLYRDLE